MARKAISDQLKSTITTAFGRQRDFARNFEESMPVIHEKLIDIAQIQAGQSINSETLTRIANDVMVLAETFKQLAERGEAATMEANIAAMKLKEYEDSPGLIAEDLVDAATILANADVWMQTSADFVTQTIELALPKTRQTAISRLTRDTLIAWGSEISHEMRRRSQSNDPVV